MRVLPWWNDDRDRPIGAGGGLGIGRDRLCARRARGVRATAADDQRHPRLDQRETVRERYQRRADDPDCRVACLGGPASRRVPTYRRGLERRRSRGLLAVADAAGSRRLLGLHPRTLGLSDLRFLPDRRTLAGRSVFRHAGIWNRVAVMARDAASRRRRGLFFCSPADRVVPAPSWFCAAR